MALSNYKTSHYRLKEMDPKNFFDYLIAEFTYEIKEQNSNKTLPIVLVLLHFKSVQYAVNSNIEDRLIDILDFSNKLSIQLEQLNKILALRDTWSEHDLYQLDAINEAKGVTDHIIEGLSLLEWEPFGEIITAEFNYHDFLDEYEDQMNHLKSLFENLKKLKFLLRKARIEMSSFLDILLRLSDELSEIERFFLDLSNHLTKQSSQLDYACRSLILYKLGSLCKQAIDLLKEEPETQTEIAFFTKVEDVDFLKALSLQNDTNVDEVISIMRDYYDESNFWPDYMNEF